MIFKILNLLDNSFFIGFILTLISSVTLSIVYKRFGIALSGREKMSQNLILISLTTFLVISSIKSSIALSLGMVGALSIIRFRVAIKEPEEAVYLFLSLSIAIAYAAGLMTQTFIITILIFVLIILINLFYKKNITKIYNNSLITIKSKKITDNSYENKLIEILNNSQVKYEIKLIERSEKEIIINFFVLEETVEIINDLRKKLLQFDYSMEFTYLNTEDANQLIKD